MNVGSRVLEVFDAVQGASVPTWVLYPTRDEARAERFDGFVVRVAQDATLEGEGLPLVLVSHGTGSSPWLFRDVAAHLASAGFVVALVRHPGNNRGDDSLAFTVTNLENRPRHLHLVIDAALASPPLGPRLSTGGVAVIGHSLGGYTALALAGGQPTTSPNETSDGTARTLEVVRDARVRALVLLAPATGWFLREGALAQVDIPIFLRTGAEDEYAPPIHGDLVRRGVPDPSRVDLQVVPNAGHFSFMSVFPEERRRPEVLPAHDPPGFDRARYQRMLQDEVVSFLRRSLAVHRSGRSHAKST